MTAKPPGADIPTELILSPGQMTYHAVFKALSPTSSMTAWAPLPWVAFIISFTGSAFAKLIDIQPSAFARDCLLGIESITKIRAGLYSRAQMIEHSATGPQPMATDVIFFHNSAGMSLKAFFAPLNRKSADVRACPSVGFNGEQRPNRSEIYRSSRTTILQDRHPLEPGTRWCWPMVLGNIPPTIHPERRSQRICI